LKSKLIKFSLYLVAGYLLVVVAIFLFQDKIIFQADKLDEAYEFKFAEPFTEITIFTGENNKLNGLVFNPKDVEPKGTILYFHGNADNLQRWGQYAVDFTTLGYSVLMIDYSGYGKSSGTPSELMLYQNAEDTWQWAQSHLPGRNFIIYGRSLGTAVAAQLASKHQASQLILETPFYQIEQTRFRFLLLFGDKYKFANYQYLPEVKYPITIFQGTNDEVVPYSSALKLKPFLKQNDKFIVIEGGGHKNLRTFDRYHQELAKVLR
jgi:uncharacterized protein